MPVPGDDLRVPLYLPNRDAVASLALRAELRNPIPAGSTGDCAKIANPRPMGPRTILAFQG